MLVDLASLAILAKQTAQDTLATHPLDLGRHAGLRGTLTLTRAGVAALALCSKEKPSACAGVDSGRLDDDASIADEFLDVRARVGVADLGLLLRVQPDFALADARDGRREALLGAEIDHLHKPDGQ